MKKLTPLQKIEQSGLYSGEPYVAIHRISDFAIVEIKCHDGQHKFRPYVDGNGITGGFLNIDAAILMALAYKYNQDSGSAWFAGRVIRMELE